VAKNAWGLKHMVPKKKFDLLMDLHFLFLKMVLHDVTFNMTFGYEYSRFEFFFKKVCKFHRISDDILGGKKVLRTHTYKSEVGI
jgi:hypothetical protein